MTFDVENAAHVAGGEAAPVLPILIDGLEPEPAILTLSSQAMGDDDTVLVARHTGGRVRIFGRVKEFAPSEQTVVATDGSAYLAVGQAVWFALVAFQRATGGAIALRWVPGSVAAVADAAKPTFDEIKKFLDLDERAPFAICGDIKFHRSADTVVDSSTETIRRPAYTFVERKTGYERTQANLGERFWGFVDLPVDLTALSGLNAGDLYVDGAKLPDLPYGGRIGWVQYLGEVAGAGAGADLTIKPHIDGTVVTTDGLQLTLTNTALPSTVDSAEITGANTFKPGATVDLELDVKGTAFTGGSGVVRLAIYEYIA